MKVLLAGAFGHLGSEILRSLVNAGHEVTAADVAVREISDIPQTFKSVKVDMTNKDSMKGICDGMDVVITTVGLTKTSATVTAYDIDLGCNINLLEEAKSAKVPHFVYTSVIKVDEAPDVPMLDAKNKFEIALKESGLTYTIFRPTGYFYDIAHIFQPMVEKGKVTLLGKKPIHCNIVDCPDFANYIVEHMTDENKTYNIGGKETYSYQELANLFFAAAGKEPKISYAPSWLFDVLANLPKNKKNGKQAIIKFSKFTLTHDLVGDTVIGDKSFKEYVYSLYKK